MPAVNSRQELAAFVKAAPWVATLHRGASAAFLVCHISLFTDILFSICQGDPHAVLLFIIYLEPFLVRLMASLHGLQLTHVREASFGYMDDVEILGSHISNITTVDIITLAFEVASGALLNRNRRPSSSDLVPGQAIWTGLFPGYRLQLPSRCLG